MSEINTGDEIMDDGLKDSTGWPIHEGSYVKVTRTELLGLKLTEPQIIRGIVTEILTDKAGVEYLKIRTACGIRFASTDETKVVKPDTWGPRLVELLNAYSFAPPPRQRLY